MVSGMAVIAARRASATPLQSRFCRRAILIVLVSGPLLESKCKSLQSIFRCLTLLTHSQCSPNSMQHWKAEALIDVVAIYCGPLHSAGLERDN